jgi:hypothetical protein
MVAFSNLIKIVIKEKKSAIFKIKRLGAGR